MDNQPLIIVINLLKDTDKKTKIKAQLSALNLNYCFFEAVDGSKLSATKIDQIYDRRATRKSRKRDLSSGEIGCALSHIGIYKKILADNIDYAIILEDDALIGADFVQTINNIKHLPKDWELFLLGWQNSRLCYAKCQSHQNFSGFSIIKPMSMFGGTYAYIINQKGCEKMLTHTQKIGNPIDYYTGGYKICNLYAILPTVADFDQTLISGMEFNRKQTISDVDFSKVIKLRRQLRQRYRLARELTSFVHWFKYKINKKIQCRFRKLLYAIQSK